MTNDEIEALLVDISPGPWEFNEEDGSIESIGEHGGCVGHIQHHGSVRTIHKTGEQFSHADGRFIAAARQLVPDLLARLEEAKQNEGIQIAREGGLLSRIRYLESRIRYLEEDDC